MVNVIVTRVSIRLCARVGFCTAGEDATAGAERMAHFHVCMVESSRLFPSARPSCVKEQWLLNSGRGTCLASQAFRQIN